MGNTGKENFYLFLDIDGVLWDWKWRIGLIKQGMLKRGGSIRDFNPESVIALNRLTDYLDKRYNLNMVISSTWRCNRKFTDSVLRKNGVKILGELEYTPITNTPSHRGDEILLYLQNKVNADNVLIIDDEYFDFPKYFKKCEMIKTDIYTQSLCNDMVDKWIILNNKKLDIVIEESLIEDM